MSIIPNLTNIAESDTDYVDKINANHAALITSLTEVDAALASAFQGTAFLFGADWGRRIAGGSGGDETTGVVGPYSLVFENDDVNEQFALASNNADGVSAAIFGTQRRQISGDLTGDLNDLSLSDGDYTVYAGIALLGATSFSLEFSTTQADVDLPLYQFDLNVDTAATQVFTIDNVQRIPRTLLFDNTWLQLEQERLRTISFRWHETTQSPDDVYLYVPYDHEIVNIGVLISSSDTAASSVWQLRNAADTVIGTISWDEAESDEDVGILKITEPTALQVGKVEAAGSVYRWNRSAGSGSIDSGMLIMEVIPHYNVPVI